MAGLRILIPGTGPGTGPTIPAALYSPGLAGWDHRYVASRLGTVDGSQVPVWTDEAASGGINLVPTPSPGVSRIIHEVESDVEYVRLTSLASNTTVLSAVGDAIFTRPRTIAVLARVPVFNPGTSIYFQANGYSFQFNSNGNVNVVGAGSGSSAGTLTTPLVDRTQWHLVIASLTGDSATTFSRDGVEATGTAPTAGPDALMKALVSSVAGSGFQNDFAEIIQWPFATTAQQRTDIYTAMAAHYSVI